MDQKQDYSVAPKKKLLQLFLNLNLKDPLVKTRKKECFLFFKPQIQNKFYREFNLKPSLKKIKEKKKNIQGHSSN